MHDSIFALASIEATRPVFMIVMGVFLAIFAWRLARGSGPWAARFLLCGAFLLCAGYSLVMPMYAAGILRPPQAGGSPGTGLGNPLLWQVLRMLLMNLGWLLFGVGLALHAGLFRTSRKLRSHNPEILAARAHEPVA